MVFLRLTVKVFPREQAQSQSWVRSILGNGERDRDDSAGSSSSNGAGKPASFLLTLHNPEEITLGGLAGMIQEKWRKLRPETEPLEIKKLLDDDHDTDDLDPDLTVADVFVNNGKAEVDKLDQRACVRVIQKPAPYAPRRFPSVALDWDSAAHDFERRKREKIEAVQQNNLNSIPEEPLGPQDFVPTQTQSSVSTQDLERNHEVPVRSVERGDHSQWKRESPVRQDISKTPEYRSHEDQQRTVQATPEENRIVSQELGESQSPGSTQSPTPGARRSASASSSRSRHSARSTDKTQTQKTDDASLSPLTTRKEPPQAAKKDASAFIDNEANEGADTSESEYEDEDADEEESEQEDDNKQENSGEEDEESSNEDSESENESQDNDGDVPMKEDAPAQPKKAETPEPKPAHSTSPKRPSVSGPGPDSRKRKKSPEESHPNKEPRLDARASPAGSRSKGNQSPPPKVLLGSPGSPSAMRRRERAPSFSQVGRRLSFSDKTQDSPKRLGLGITASPQAKRSVMYDTPKNGTHTAGAPARRASIFDQHVHTTPSNHRSPSPGRGKLLHSALRKDSSPSRRPSERRSVSFAEGDEIVPSSSAPAPRSVPEGTPGSAGRRMSWNPDDIVYPPNSQPEKAKQHTKETEPQKHNTPDSQTAQREPSDDRRTSTGSPNWQQKKAELDQKIETAEKQKENQKERRPYVQKLRAASRTLSTVINNEGATKKREKERHLNAISRFEELQSEIEQMEPPSKTTPQQAPKSHSKSQPKSAEEDVSPVPEAPKGATVNNSNGGPGMSRFEAAKRREQENSAKKSASAPTAKAQNGSQNGATKDRVNGTTPTSSKKEKSKPAADEPPKSAQQQSESGSESGSEPESKNESSSDSGSGESEGEGEEESDSDSESEEESAPAQKAESPKANGSTTKSAKPNGALQNGDVSSSDSDKEEQKQKNAEAESDSDEESDEESESDSDKSDKDNGNANANGNGNKNEPSKSDSSRRVSAPSSQPTSKTPAMPSSQKPGSASQPPSASQPTPSQPWKKPHQQPNGTQRSRLSLKTLILEQQREKEVKKQSKAPLAARPERKHIFDPSDDSDDDDKSESESESGSDDSGTNANAGDIMSSGDVAQLRKARNAR